MESERVDRERVQHAEMDRERMERERVQQASMESQRKALEVKAQHPTSHLPRPPTAEDKRVHKMRCEYKRMGIKVDF